MRSLALVAASLAGNALAVPMIKERALVTDLDIVTITQYVTATGPCPSTGVTNTVSVTEQAVSSSSVSSYVVVTSYTSSAAAETTPAAVQSVVIPSVVTVSPVPVSSSSAVETVALSSTYVAPSTTATPSTTAAPTTSATPSTTATPTSSVAGGFSTYAFCATPSVDSTARLTAQPTDLAAKRWLAFHNAHRANHTDGCSMYWDYDLAEKAQEAADTCQYKHTIDGNTNYGQNMGQMQYTIKDVGKVTSDNINQAPAYFSNMYYEEYNDFGPYWGAATVPTDGPNILHFTQMVWKKSYAVGCAVQKCDNDQLLLTFCNYRPRGNILDEYGDNVGLFIDNPHPPICSEIGSTATDGSCITDAELGL